MELNTSGLNKPVPEMNPGPEMLAMMAERCIRVVVGSDSHIPWRVGADFDAALAMLDEAGFDEVSVFKKRQPTAYKIADARRSLAVNRSGISPSTAGAL